MAKELLLLHRAMIYMYMINYVRIYRLALEETYMLRRMEVRLDLVLQIQA